MKTSKIFLSAFSAFLMIGSLNVFAADTPECAGEIAVPSLHCMNPTGEGKDVRFYLIEYQTCKNEKIVELDRTILGMNVLSHDSLDDIHTINPESISIEYASERVLIDAANRADNLSFLMPNTISMVDGEDVINLTVTDELEPDYEGAYSFHFKGRYDYKTADGKITTGKLDCSVSR